MINLRKETRKILTISVAVICIFLAFVIILIIYIKQTEKKYEEEEKIHRYMKRDSWWKTMDKHTELMSEYVRMLTMVQNQQIDHKDILSENWNEQLIRKPHSSLSDITTNNIQEQEIKNDDKSVWEAEQLFQEKLKMEEKKKSKKSKEKKMEENKKFKEKKPTAKSSTNPTQNSAIPNNSSIKFHQNIDQLLQKLPDHHLEKLFDLNNYQMDRFLEEANNTNIENELIDILEKINSETTNDQQHEKSEHIEHIERQSQLLTENEILNSIRILSNLVPHSPIITNISMLPIESVEIEEL